MSMFNEVLTAALDAARTQAQGLADEYKLRLEAARVNAQALLDDVEAGTVTVAQAQAAAEQEVEALRSLLLAGALDARTQAAIGGVQIVAAVLRALLALA